MNELEFIVTQSALEGLQMTLGEFESKLDEIPPSSQALLSLIKNAILLHSGYGNIRNLEDSYNKYLSLEDNE